MYGVVGDSVIKIENCIEYRNEDRKKECDWFVTERLSVSEFDEWMRTTKFRRGKKIISRTRKSNYLKTGKWESSPNNPFGIVIEIPVDDYRGLGKAMQIYTISGMSKKRQEFAFETLKEILG